MLVRAYAAGIFPMAEQRGDASVFWIDPKMRGIIPLDGFLVPASLRKRVRKGEFQITVNRDFEAVIRACAEPAPQRRETWINQTIVDAYCGLNHLGLAHSVECRRDGRLVGGLYGVALGGAFCGESMFSRETDASKVALVHLVARLRLGGFTLLDTQFVTGHLARFGCIEVPARDYQQRLAAALEVDARFPVALPADQQEKALAAVFASAIALAGKRG